MPLLAGHAWVRTGTTAFQATNCRTACPFQLLPPSPGSPAQHHPPVRRRSLPSPYAAMCTACRLPSLAIWSWMACQPVPAARVALEEKLVWPPAPFQSPATGLGSKVTSMLYSSAGGDMKPGREGER